MAASRTGARAALHAPTTQSFDVICAGEARWDLDAPRDAFSGRPASPRFQPGGGAVNTALELAQRGLRVGLATVLPADGAERELCARLAAAGVDTGGVALAPPRGEIVFVDGSGAIDAPRSMASYWQEERAVAVPAAWSSQVLLLSGLSPVVSQAGAQCKAARAARRAGAIVVIDANARLRLWAGRDPKIARMALREADVVRCSAADLAVLGMDANAVRAALRPSAVLLMSDGGGSAWASGPFGEIAEPRREAGPLPRRGAGDAFTAAICAELARAGDAGEGRADQWARALRRGQAAREARAARGLGAPGW